MQEDLSTLMNELYGEDVEEKPSEEETPEPEAETPESEEETTELEAEEKTKPSPANKQNEAFAQLRASEAKRTKFFKEVTKALNIDEDTFIADLQARILGNQAKEMNVDPEVLGTLKAQQEQINALNRRDQEKTLMLSLDGLQKEFNLSNDNVKGFVQKAIESGFDLLNGNVDMPTLYKAFNHDALLKDAIDKAKQEWIAQGAKANDATAPSKGSQKTPEAKEKMETMDDLEELLSSYK